MKPALRKRLGVYHAAALEAAGMLCPLLALMSLVPELASLQGIALVSLWIGCGHTLLHYYNLCPVLRWNPFFKGLFAFGAGVLWPLWFLPRTPIGR